MNTYAIPLTLYVKAIDPDRAAAQAEINVYVSTDAIRKGGFIEDTTSIVVTSGAPTLVNELPTQSYIKQTLIDVFGEEEAIRILNSYALNS